MNESILVPSVQHSGADILVNHFLASYPQGTLKGITEGVIIHDHVLYTKLPTLLSIAKHSDQVIIPIRHPKVVAVLWERNHLELDPDFYQMWDAIQQFAELDNVHFLAMDVDDMDQRIEVVEINSKLQFEHNFLLTEREKQDFALRPYNIKYTDISDGLRVQELSDDLEDFLSHVYGVVDPNVPPSREESEKARKKKAQEARPPKDSWKHICPATDEAAYTKKGQICKNCGAEE